MTSTNKNSIFVRFHDYHTTSNITTCTINFEDNSEIYDYYANNEDDYIEYDLIKNKIEDK